MAEKAEHALIECLKQKSAEAFEELVARYGRRLYSVSLRILRNPEDAEDAVQDSFLSVYRNIDRFREESSLYTWLYRIACNQALAKRREQGRAYVAPTEPYLARFPEGQQLDEILDWSHMPDVLLSTQEIQGFFEKCIDELPEEFRIAYILKDVEKLTEDEVCEILGITKFAMKNRVHRARLVLRKRVEDFFFGEGARRNSPR